MKNGDRPISPIFNSDGATTVIASWINSDGSGLTKREYFAAMAMQGIMASGLLTKDKSKYLWNHGNEISTTALAEDARRCADALLAELEKPTDK